MPPTTPPTALPENSSAVAVAAGATRDRPTDSTATGIQLDSENTVIEFAM